MEHAAEIREPRDKGGRLVKGGLREMLSKFEKKPEIVRLPGGREMEAKPIPEIEAAAESYMKGIGRPGEEKVSDFVGLNPEFAAAVARAFQEMRHNPKDPAVRRAYDALIDETMAQYRALKDTGIDFRFLREGQADPYAKSPALGYEDIAKKGRLFVFPTEQGFGSTGGLIADNPLLKRVGPVGDLPNAMANDAFRVVHDAYGHFGPGNPFFRAPGEERAYQLHSRMYSPEALPAMTSETRGQNSWVNYGPNAAENRAASGAETVYADQKIGRLPDWTMGSADDPEVVKQALKYLNERNGFDKGGSAVKKTLKSAMANKSLQAALEERAARYVADPAERAANLAQWQSNTPASVTEPRWYHGSLYEVPQFTSERPAFVTQNPEFANTFASFPKNQSLAGQTLEAQLSGEAVPQPNIMPMHVRANNPFDYSNKKHMNALVEHLGPDLISDPYLRSVMPEVARGHWENIESDAIQKAIKSLGHDAFYVMEEGNKNLAVYNPERQLKSATGNLGTFDPKNPRLDENRGGSVVDRALVLTSKKPKR
jgi:hypothetical protein